jgi:hypothetical protein
MFPGFGPIVGIGVFAMAVGFALIAILPSALAYVALRVQDTRQSTPDPKLGMKTAFHLVHTIAILLILTGLTVFMLDVLEGTIAKRPNLGPNFPGGGGGRPAKPAGLNEMQRVAIALIASGLLFGVVFWAFLLGTNDSERRSVRRVFVGGRLALCLLILMITVTTLLINLIQKNASDDLTESLLALLIVWFPAAAIHMVLFFINTSGGGERRSRRESASDDDRGWRPED